MTIEKRPIKVFLCHASADKPVVRELYQRLTRDGIDAWLDLEDLLPGQKWQIEIPKAVCNSDVVLVCLSNNSINKEGYIQKEIIFALDKAVEMPEGRIFLIPVRLDDCQVPHRLSAYQWVDLFSENGYERMVLALRVRAEQVGLMPPIIKGRDPILQHVSKLPESKQKREAPVFFEEEKLSGKLIGVPKPGTITEHQKENFSSSKMYIYAIVIVVAITITMIISSTLIQRWFTQGLVPFTTQLPPPSTSFLAAPTVTDKPNSLKIPNNTPPSVFLELTEQGTKLKVLTPSDYGQLLYEENFDSDLLTWEIYEGSSIQNGVLTIMPSSSARPISNPEFTDFIFEIALRWDYPQVGSDSCFYIRYQLSNINNSIQVCVVPYSKTVRAMMLREGEIPMRLLSESVASQLDPNNWNVLTIIANGNDFEIYINGIYVKGFTATTYQKGAFAFNSDEKFSTFVDYVRIYAIP